MSEVIYRLVLPRSSKYYEQGYLSFRPGFASGKLNSLTHSSATSAFAQSRSASCSPCASIVKEIKHMWSSCDANMLGTVQVL
eukprot:5201025-Amphidinium_carterae.1